jgi:hypothetical protein
MSRSNAASASTEFEDASDADLQRIMATTARIFAARYEHGGISDPFGPGSGVTATDVAIVASAMLRSVNMQVFELGLWQSWQGGR